LIPVGIPFVRQILEAKATSNKNSAIVSTFIFLILCSPLLFVGLKILILLLPLKLSDGKTNTAFIFYFICYSFFLWMYNSMRGLLKIKQASLALFLGLGLFPLVIAVTQKNLKVSDFFIWSGFCLVANILFYCKNINFSIYFKKNNSIYKKVKNNFINGFPRASSSVLYQGSFLAGPTLLIHNGLFKEAGFLVVAQNIPKFFESLTEGIYRAGVPLLIPNFNSCPKSRIQLIDLNIEIIGKAVFCFGLFFMSFILLNSQKLAPFLYGKDYINLVKYFDIVALSVPWFMLFSVNKTFLEAAKSNNLNLACTSVCFSAFCILSLLLKPWLKMEQAILVSFSVSLALLGITSSFLLHKQLRIKEKIIFKPLLACYFVLVSAFLIFQPHNSRHSEIFEKYLIHLNVANLIIFLFFTKNLIYKIFKK